MNRLGSLGSFRGFGDVADLASRLASLDRKFAAFQAETASLIGAHPELSDPAAFTDFAIRVAAKDPSAILRLTQAQFSTLVRALAISTKGNVVRVQQLLPAGDPARRTITALLDAGERNMAVWRALLSGVEELNADVAIARRAVGLGVAPLVIVAGIVAGTIVALAVTAVVYAVLSAVHASSVAQREADRACALDAAAGSPCTGAQRQAYYNAVHAEEIRSGLVPALDDALRRTAGAFSDVILYGGLAVVAAVIVYGAWTAAPAAKLTRDALTSRAQALRGAPEAHARANRRLYENVTHRRRAWETAARHYDATHSPTALAAKRAAREHLEDAERQYSQWGAHKTIGGFNGTPAEHEAQARYLLQQAGHAARTDARFLRARAAQEATWAKGAAGKALQRQIAQAQGLAARR